MKTIVKKFLASILSVSLAMSFAGTVYANEEAYAYSDSDLAGMILVSTMESILADYNDDIDYDTLVKAALYGMFDSLDDYSAYMQKEDYENFIADIKPNRFMFGIVFQKLSDGSIRIRDIYEDSSAIEAGLEAGDILVSANGVSVEGMSVSEAIEELNKIAGNTANVVFSRGAVQMEVVLERRALANKTVFVYKVEDILEIEDTKETADVRLVQITAVGENTATEMKAVIDELNSQGITKIILDLRGNEGGYFDVGISLCKMLVSRGAVLSKIESGDRILTYYSAQAKAPFDEIVVLTDGYTASAAEMVAACLKDRGSVIIGHRTYGKASIQSIYDTYGGMYKLTTGEYLSPLGTKINKIGIDPDVYVEMPGFLNYTLETSGADIAQIKKILAYCGYETGNNDEVYDEITKASVIKAKEAMGLEANDKVDIYVKDALNEMYLKALEQKDTILEAAYNHMFNK